MKRMDKKGIGGPQKMNRRVKKMNRRVKKMNRRVKKGIEGSQKESQNVNRIIYSKPSRRIDCSNYGCEPSVIMLQTVGRPRFEIGYDQLSFLLEN